MLNGARAMPCIEVRHAAGHGRHLMPSYRVDADAECPATYTIFRRREASCGGEIGFAAPPRSC